MEYQEALASKLEEIAEMTRYLGGCFDAFSTIIPFVIHSWGEEHTERLADILHNLQNEKSILHPVHERSRLEGYMNMLEQMAYHLGREYHK